MCEVSAGVIGGELFDDVDDARRGFFGVERGVFAAHVRADPSGVDGDADDVVLDDLACEEEVEHVECGFAGAVGVRAGGFIVVCLFEAAHGAGDLNDLRGVLGCGGLFEVWQESGGDAHGADGVGFEAADGFGAVECGEVSAFCGVDAGVVDEDVKGCVFEGFCEFLNGLVVVCVELFDAAAGGFDGLFESPGVLWCSGGADDGVAFCGEGSCDCEPDASVGAGDDGVGVHGLRVARLACAMIESGGVGDDAARREKVEAFKAKLREQRDRWGVTQGRVEGQPMIARVRMDAAAGERAGWSACITLALRLEEETEQGLPTMAEQGRLDGVEDRVTRLVEGVGGAVLALLISTGGRRELVLYAESVGWLEANRDGVGAALEPFAADVLVDDDPGWSFYGKFREHAR